MDMPGIFSNSDIDGIYGIMKWVEVMRIENEIGDDNNIVSEMCCQKKSYYFQGYIGHTHLTVGAYKTTNKVQQTIS